MDKHALLRRIKARLQDAFGDRLCGVVLYGSEARGDARADSDIDIMVLLKSPIRLWQDLRKSNRALYPLVLEINRVIEPRVVDIRSYEAAEMPLCRNAKREGILV